MHEITTEKEPQKENTELKIQAHEALSQQGYQAGVLRSNSSIQVYQGESSGNQNHSYSG